MTWLWILIGVVVFLVIVAAIASVVLRGMQTKRLKERFGSEYDRTVEADGGRRQAETDLRDRERRRERLDIRPLSPEARERYATRWQAVQGRFVDRPSDSLQEADDLVQGVMRDRGYPVEDFEQRTADVSVDHPDVVEHYRSAHRVSQRIGEGAIDTEEQRQAMVHYRALFDELLHERPTPAGSGGQADPG